MCRTSQPIRDRLGQLVDAPASRKGHYRSHRPRFSPAAALYARGVIEQGALLLVNQRRVGPEPAPQLDRGKDSNATFALNSGACCLRFNFSDLLVAEDQQIADRSLRQCPIFGEHLKIWRPSKSTSAT